MTDDTHIASPTFADAAKRVQNRLILRSGLRRLLQTWPYAAGLLVLLLALHLLGISLTGRVFPWLLLALWTGGCFGWAYHRRPSPYAALAHWDSATQRHEAFANAWWFERLPQRTAPQATHLETHRDRLAQALTALRVDLALPDARWLGAPLLLALACSFLASGRDDGLPNPKLTAEGKELAKREGKKLAEAKIEADKLKGLTTEEKKEVEKLQQKVADSAQTLGAGGSRTAREVLGELEKRAREAEKIADKLGAGDMTWASAQMVEEMRKHVDTADLGDAVASHAAERTGQKAQEIADTLRDAKLNKDAQGRYAETLREIGKKAEPADKDRLVGQHVIAADKDLTQTLPKDAGGEFQAIADKMRSVASREKAREELEKLAQQLRSAGSTVAGQGTQGMQQLGGAPGSSGQAQQGQMLTLQNAPAMPALQPPSFSDDLQNGMNDPNRTTQGKMAIVSGDGMTAPPGKGKNNGGAGGGEPGKDGQPMLFAPIPGKAPPPSPDDKSLAMAIQVPGMGGPKAGQGTAPLGNDPTEKRQAGQAATVNAQRNADGASSVRAVEGQTHNEEAARKAEASSLATILAEENAVDDAALPPARREQVRRYFTELRQRFEKEK